VIRRRWLWLGAVVIAVAVVVFRWVGGSDLSLDARLAKVPIVHAAEIADDWDQVCVATPYCAREDGEPAEMEDVCKQMPDESDYGLGFFRAGKVTHIEYYTKNPKKLTSTRPCFLRDEDPVIVLQDGNLRVRAASEAP